MTAISLHPRRYSAVAAVTAVAALALTACASPTTDNAAEEATTTTMTAASETAEAEEAAEDSAAPESSEQSAESTEAGAPPDDTVVSMLNGGAAAGPSQAAATGHGLTVTEVRVGDHDGFDRVVLEFTGEGDPGWFADFTSDPRQQGSGFPIEFTGDTALSLMATGVALPFDAGVEPMPTGPIADAAGDITGVTHNGVFEGQSQFVIGLNGEPRPYTVNILQEPTRLVIDIEDL